MVIKTMFLQDFFILKGFMKCFYCNNEMKSEDGLYVCRDSELIGEFWHIFDFYQNNVSDKEFRLYKPQINNYCAIFYSLKSSNLTESNNSFFLEDFDILKEIKTSKQLQHLIDKLKVFK